MNPFTPVFTPETAPIVFETTIDISDYSFGIFITDSEPFSSLDSFAEECFRQIIECGVSDGLLKSEFTPAVCERLAKKVIKQFKRLTDLASISDETVLTQELVMFPELYAKLLITSLGDNAKPVEFFTELRLQKECEEMVRDSNLKENRSFSTTFTVSFEFSITVEGTDKDKLSELVDSTAYDVTSQLKDIICDRYRNIHTEDEVTEVRYSDYDICCDELEED